MPLLKRQLHSHRASPLSLGGDWWYLVFDTDTKRFYVEHQWEYDRARPGDKTESGAVELEITAYLRCDRDGPGQRELVRLFETMFEASRIHTTDINQTLSVRLVMIADATDQWGELWDPASWQ